MLAGFLTCCLAIGGGYMTGNNYNINLTINNLVVDDSHALEFDVEVDYYNYDLGYSPITFKWTDSLQNFGVTTYEASLSVELHNLSMDLDSSTYTAWVTLDLSLYFSTYDLEGNYEALEKRITTQRSMPYRAGSTVEKVYTRYPCKRGSSAYFYDYDLIYWNGYHSGSDDAAAIYSADWLGWIGNTLSSIMDIELFMGFTLGGIFGTCIIIAIAIWFLKMFTGG